MRCFVAAEIPDGIRAAAVRLQESLRESGADVAWTAPESMHLTLKFLGELDEARVARLQPLLAAAAAGVAPVRLEIAGTGTFGGRRGPRVVWAGVKGHLGPMAAAAERAAEEVGVPREARPYRAHLTLGRIQGDRGAAGLERRLGERSGEVLGGMEVRGWTLFRSTLRPGGAVHEALARFPIGG